MKKVITASNYEVIPLDLRTNVRFYTSVDFGSYVPPHWHDAIEIHLFTGGRTESKYGKHFQKSTFGNVR